jgi:hypothetical protein
MRSWGPTYCGSTVNLNLTVTIPYNVSTFTLGDNIKVNQLINWLWVVTSPICSSTFHGRSEKEQETPGALRAAQAGARWYSQGRLWLIDERAVLCHQ